MAKAQGSLEYLIIISAVLAIAAITVFYITGVFSSQKPGVSISTCREAASNCQASKMTSPNDPCTICDSACKDPTTNREVFTGATTCCKKARADMIYVGSSGNC